MGPGVPAVQGRLAWLATGRDRPGVVGSHWRRTRSRDALRGGRRAVVAGRRLGGRAGRRAVVPRRTADIDVLVLRPSLHAVPGAPRRAGTCTPPTRPGRCGPGRPGRSSRRRSTTSSAGVRRPRRGRSSSWSTRPTRTTGCSGATTGSVGRSRHAGRPGVAARPAGAGARRSSCSTRAARAGQPDRDRRTRPTSTRRCRCSPTRSERWLADAHRAGSPGHLVARPAQLTPHSAATCRLSVPQQPPTIRRFGRLARSPSVRRRPGRPGRPRRAPAPRRARRATSGWRWGAAPRSGPRAVSLERRGDVGRVGAVDDVVVGRGHGVDALDRVLQRGAVGQPPVGLDGEADRDRQPGVRTARTKPIASPAR